MTYFQAEKKLTVLLQAFSIKNKSGYFTAIFLNTHPEEVSTFKIQKLFEGSIRKAEGSIVPI
jgi:hypothetical protein